MPEKGRTFIFTLNNYDDSDVERLGQHWDRHFTYLGFGREIAPTTGTPHLQGVCRARNSARVRNISRLLAGICELADGKAFHVEIARGSFKQCRDYCKKDGFFTEYGQPPAQGSRTDLKCASALIAGGQSVEDAVKHCPEVFVKYHKGLWALQALKIKPRHDPPDVRWLWGPTGTGKTRAAFEAYPQAYFKDCRSLWWDGYTGQECVILDDFRPCKDMPLAYMLRLLDRYPMQVQFKGGYVQFNSPIIYITAPLGPRELYEGLPFDIAVEDINQLVRRITTVTHFPITPFNDR